MILQLSMPCPFTLCMNYCYVTGVSREAILKSFGHFFFKTCKTSGHSRMLRTLGHDLRGFLMNLDSLHDHLALSYTQMQAPSFRCGKTDKGLMLHYHSQRYGLDSIVTGIVMEVAKDVYNLDVEMRRIKYEKTETSLPHHYVFVIEATESTEDTLERKRYIVSTGEGMCILNVHYAGAQNLEHDVAHSILFQCVFLDLKFPARAKHVPLCSCS